MNLGLKMFVASSMTIKQSTNSTENPDQVHKRFRSIKETSAPTLYKSMYNAPFHLCLVLLKESYLCIRPNVCCLLN